VRVKSGGARFGDARALEGRSFNGGFAAKKEKKMLLYLGGGGLATDANRKRGLDTTYIRAKNPEGP